MNSKPLPQRASAMPIWRRDGFAAALALGLAGAFSGPVAVAGECSIEAHGEAVYARVQAILKNKLSNAREVEFAPYDDINIELLPGCVFKLDGKFHVATDKGGRIKFKHFYAEFTRKDGAPMGFKKLKFSVSG